MILRGVGAHKPPGNPLPPQTPPSQGGLIGATLTRRTGFLELGRLTAAE